MLSSWKQKLPGELLMFINKNDIDVKKILYERETGIPIYAQIVPDQNEHGEQDFSAYRTRIEIRLDELLQYIIEHIDHKRLCNYFLMRSSFQYGISVYFLSTHNKSQQQKLYGIYRVKLAGLLSNEIEYTLDPIIQKDTNEFLGINISCQTISGKIIVKYGF